MHSDPAITLIGQTNGRHPHRVFGIRAPDRAQHVYIIGRTGTGKSTLLESLARQDIEHGNGLAIIDPHGDLATRLHNYALRTRPADVLYLAPADPGNRYTYNPLKEVPVHLVPLAASGVLEAFRKLWAGEWGVRMEHILRNTLYALLEAGGASLPDILRMYSDRSFRISVLARVHNEQVLQFWKTEFAKFNPRFRQEAISPIQNKIGAFLADPRLRRVVTKGGTDIRLRDVMDRGQILVVNLSKGRFGEDSASLLGALLVSAVTFAALSRAHVPEHERRPFYLYIDEFQSYTTLSVATMISELRKYGLGLTLANQHLGQLSPEIRQAVLGNVATIVVFRVGAEDASLLARELGTPVSPEDLLVLPDHSVYLRLMIDGAPSRAFSANTLSPALTFAQVQARRKRGP